MFRYKLLRNFIYSSGFNQRNVNAHPTEFSGPFLNSRCIVNYKTNQNNQADKLFRTSIYCKYLRLIKTAIRVSGPVIQLNPRLAQVIENAKKNNLPPEFIDYAQRISVDVRAMTGLYDFLLPNGCHFLIQYEDVDTSTTKHHLVELCDKVDGTLIQYETIWPRIFHQKGIILVSYKDFSQFSEETLFKLGVESYHKEIDAEGTDYLKLYCDPWQLPLVKEKICEITNQKVEEAYVGYIPKKKIRISPYIKNYVFTVIGKLSEIPTIDNFFVNVILDQ